MTAPTIPGAVHPAMPAEEYHAHPALSSSQARDLLVTPARYRWRKEHPEEPTRAMQLGTLVHSEALGVGPTAWVTEEESWRAKDVQAEVAAKTAEGYIVIKPSEWLVVSGMTNALLAHPLAGPLLDPGRGLAEQSLFWTDPKTGVPCRARPDMLPHNRRSIVDLKTTGDVSPSGLGRLFAAHGYPIQARWYQRGCVELGLVDEGVPFVFVFVSREPPHEVVVAQADGEDLRWADERCDVALQRYRDCDAAGVWPSYPTEPITVRMPPWARRDDPEEYLP